MPEIGHDYITALVDDARKIAAGLQSVSEVSITLVGRGSAPRAHALSQDQRVALAGARAAVQDADTLRARVVFVRLHHLEALIAFVAAVTGE